MYFTLVILVSLDEYQINDIPTTQLPQMNLNLGTNVLMSLKLSIQPIVETYFTLVLEKYIFYTATNFVVNYDEMLFKMN